jgi:hypothetical protein
VSPGAVDLEARIAVSELLIVTRKIPVFLGYDTMGHDEWV